MTKADANQTIKDFCFVIGPIGEAGSVIRKLADMILKGVIKPALETAPFSKNIKRADDDTRPGIITDHIINDIFSAEIVVADLTGLNPNVLYELGIAHMARKPTIPIALVGTQLPFDNLAQRTIFVDTTDIESIASAKERIRNAAEEISKDGYIISNPVIQANNSYKLQLSSDPTDRIVSALQDQVDTLSSKLDLMYYSDTPSSAVRSSSPNWHQRTSRSPADARSNASQLQFLMQRFEKEYKITPLNGNGLWQLKFIQYANQILDSEDWGWRIESRRPSDLSFDLSA